MGIKGSSGSKANYSISNQGSMHIASDTVLNRVQDNLHQSLRLLPSSDQCQGSPATTKDLKQSSSESLNALRGKSYCQNIQFLLQLCLFMLFFFKNHNNIYHFGS